MTKTEERAPLVDALVGLQGANNWNDAEMAARIGVSRQMWVFLRCGERRPGVETLRGIAAAFPDLAEAVRFFVAPVVRGGQS